MSEVEKKTSASKRRNAWHYAPPLPLKLAPLYGWPPRPAAIVGFLLKGWNPLKDRFLILLVAFALWYYTSPSIERAASLEFDWIAQIWIRNFLVTLVTAGGLHLYFYTFKAQGDRLRYDLRQYPKKGKPFHFGNQLWDNVFWTMGSAVFFWTAWEVALMWAYANGIATLITFESNPVWFVALFLLIPFWASFFFSTQHRILHWEPLYRNVHFWHHKNINVGPWSGLAMHPVEHFLLHADTILYFVIASHPVHAIFNFLHHGMLAPMSHTGFDGIQVGNRKVFDFGDFFHQIHHRSVACNHGALDQPWDTMFGTFHDGTPEADRAIQEMVRKKAEAKKA